MKENRKEEKKSKGREKKNNRNSKNNRPTQHLPLVCSYVREQMDGLSVC